MSNKINLFISSKNRKHDETTSKLSVVLPDALLSVSEGEYFTISIVNFHIFNQFYNVRNGYNNHIQLIKNDIEITDIYLNEGSYNALSLLQQLNEKLLNLNVLYDKYKNKYIFENKTTDKYVINIINSHQLLGFTNSTVDILGNSSIISQIPINLITDNFVNIAISGDIELQANNIHNYRNEMFEPSNIIYQKYLNTTPFSLSLYSNEDGGNNFKYVLNNRESINYFTLEITNQNLEIIDGLPDYYITIQFEKHTINDIKQSLNTIINYIKQIFQMGGLILEYLKIL